MQITNRLVPSALALSLVVAVPGAANTEDRPEAESSSVVSSGPTEVGDRKTGVIELLKKLMGQ